MQRGMKLMVEGLRRTQNTLVQWITQRGRFVLCITALFAVGAVLLFVDPRTGAPRIDIDPSAARMVPADDPGRIYWEKVQAAFADGEPMLLALAGPDVFTPESLTRIQRITERLEALDTVHRVSSLARASSIHSADGGLRIAPFFDEVPTDAADLDRLRSRALSDPIYAGNLVSHDATIATIVVYPMDISERELVETGFDADVVAIAEEERGSAELWVTGVPHVRGATARLMMRDLTFVIPVTWVVMAFVAFLAFRSVRGVLIPILTVQMAQLFTLAAVGTIFGELNVITMGAPPLLVAVGLAYSIHVLAGYYDRIRETGGSEAAPALTAHVLRTVATPIFFTGLTTAIGFLALVLSPLEAIRQFGVFCALGVALTVLMALTLAPAILALLPLPRRVPAERRDDFLSRGLHELARFNTRHGRAILVSAVVIALVGLAGALRIEVGTDLISNFQASNPVRQDFAKVNEHLDGANGFHVVFESESPDAFKDPVNLRELESVQEWLAAQPEVGGSTSLADYVKLLHRSFDEAARFEIPRSRELVSQLLAIGATEDIHPFVDGDYRLARVQVRSRVMDSADVMKLVERLEAHLETLDSGLRREVSGITVLVSRTQDLLAWGQAVSLCSAFLVIYLVLAGLFRSFKFGAIALAPNILPVIVYFGILGWTGVTLNITTAIVACLVIGIAVDDTIHLLAHFTRAARRRASEIEGAEEALRSVGRPITITSFALCMGFVTMMLSDLTSQIQLGWLASLTLAVAWLVDVTLTPVLAARMKVVTVWDFLAKDAARLPHQWLPILSGMSELQARIALSQTRIEAYPEGHVLIREGDVDGDQFYTVLDGKLSASIERDGTTTELRLLGPGEIAGEIGWVRGHRTATVRSLSEVRVLRFSHAQVDRLAKRHPRITNKIYKNVVAGLAERLDSLSSRIADDGAVGRAVYSDGKSTSSVTTFQASTDSIRPFSFSR